MKGLIVKDILGIKKTFKSSFMTMLVFIVLGIVVKNSMYVTMMLSILALNYNMTALAYDEQYNFNSYALTMPISRKEIVKERYIFSTGSIVLFITIASLIVFLFKSRFTDMKTEEIAITYGILSGFMLMINYIIIPIIYKYGMKKARVAIFLISMLPFLALGYLSGKLNLEGILTEENIKMFMKIIPFIVLGTGFISYIASNKIIKEKDF